MNERLASELVKARKAVKQKYRILKNAEFEAQSKLEGTYKPITQPLQELISTLGKIEPGFVKEEPQTLQKTIYDASTPRRKLFGASTPQKKKTGKTPNLPYEIPSILESNFGNVSQIPFIEPSFSETSVIAETTPNSSKSSSSNTLNLSDILEQTRAAIGQFVDTAGYQEWLSYFDELPRQYIDAGVRDTKHDFDHVYGIVHDIEQEKMYVGTTQKLVDFQGKDIIVEKVKYPGTSGLYELLFKKQPKGYTEKDLDNYMDILKRTNAYRRNHDPAEQVQGNNSVKYVQIIGPYLQKKGITKTKNVNVDVVQRFFEGVTRPAPPRPRRRPTKGGGLSIKVNKPNTDYVYWDNVNELVDRLRLLVASMDAGHTGHNNEIISIIEELREANIIV